MSIQLGQSIRVSLSQVYGRYRTQVLCQHLRVEEVLPVWCQLYAIQTLLTPRKRRSLLTKVERVSLM